MQMQKRISKAPKSVNDSSDSYMWKMKSKVGMNPPKAEELNCSKWCTNVCTRNMWKGIARILSNTIGMGLFTTPYIFCQLGILGASATILGSAIAGLISSYFLLIAYEKYRVYNAQAEPTGTYAGIVKFALGEYMTLFFGICYLADLAGSMIARFGLSHLHIKYIIQFFLIKVNGLSAEDSDLPSENYAVYAMAGMILLFGGGIEFFMVIIGTSASKCCENDTVIATMKKDPENDQGCWKKVQKFLGSWGSFIAIMLIVVVFLPVEYTFSSPMANNKSKLNHNILEWEFWSQRSNSSHGKLVGTIFTMLPVTAMIFLNQHVLLDIVHDMYGKYDENNNIIYDQIVCDENLSINERVLSSVSCCAIVLSQFISAISCIIVGILGFFTFELLTKDNVLDNVSFTPSWVIIRGLSLIVYFFACTPSSAQASIVAAAETAIAIKTVYRRFFFNKFFKK
jgi:amino acid permease